MRIWPIFIVTLVLALVACNKPKAPPVLTITGAAQGADYRVSYWTAEPLDINKVETRVAEIFETIDKLMSNYRPDSVIESFNAHGSTDSQEVGEEIVSLVREADNISRLGGGCFDLTVKPLLQLWGFQGGAPHIPEQAEIEQNLLKVGAGKLETIDATHLRKIQPDVQVDFSAMVQGYSLSRVSQALEGFGIENYLIEIGGKFQSNGGKPDGQSWRVAVESPLPGERQIPKIFSLPRNIRMAVITSGQYQHYFVVHGQSYGHIIDARTGRPVTHNLAAVTVMHENPSLADAWSTALLCLGQQEGMRLANLQNINAIFFRQQDSELLESRSDPLRLSNILIIQ